MKPLKHLSIKGGRTFNITLFCIVLPFLFACATGSSIITGKKRPPIPSSEVNIYLDPPEEFETIGIVEVSSEVGFSRQKAQDRAMEGLKSRAAKVGANGVLLTNSQSQSVGTTGYYSNGFYVGGGTSNKLLAQGRAIYVIKE